MKPINQTTYEKVVKNETIDRLEYEIGDIKQPDFKPQYKLKRWDNEVNFSLRAEEEAGAKMNKVGNKIKYIAKDYEVHLYDKPNASNEGGFEFEWVLKKKPKTNVLKATIQTKGLDFYYQPPLTQKEIADGVDRPNNVIGSYAVYHKTKSNYRIGDKNYKTGKAFHIYRPEAVDAGGEKTWGELKIDEVASILTVKIPQTFLDSAVYPIVVDPTIGYTTIGSSTNFGFADRAQYLQGDTAPQNGTIQYHTIYAKKSSNTNIKAVIWDSSGNVITNGVGGTVLVNSTTPQWWQTSDYPTSPSLTVSTEYFIGTVVDNTMYFYTDSANYGKENIGNNYLSPTAVSTALSTVRWSIYATYTASGGSTFTPRAIIY